MIRGGAAYPTAHALALVSSLAAALWLGVIVLLHLIKPELDPRFRMVSEYARAPRGWIMQFAFFCVAVSCWALAVATWPLLPLAGPGLVELSYGYSFASGHEHA
jgi:hypothetical protein